MSPLFVTSSSTKKGALKYFFSKIVVSWAGSRRNWDGPISKLNFDYRLAKWRWAQGRYGMPDEVRFTSGWHLPPLVRVSESGCITRRRCHRTHGWSQDHCGSYFVINFQSHQIVAPHARLSVHREWSNLPQDGVEYEKKPLQSHDSCLHHVTVILIMWSSPFQIRIRWHIPDIIPSSALALCGTLISQFPYKLLVPQVASAVVQGLP